MKLIEGHVLVPWGPRLYRNGTMLCEVCVFHGMSDQCFKRVTRCNNDGYYYYWKRLHLVNIDVL